jgi:hypothetical protein
MFSRFHFGQGKFFSGAILILIVRIHVCARVGCIYIGNKILIY